MIQFLLLPAPLQIGAVVLVHSTLLLALGLLAGWAARRFGPTAQSWIYRACLVAVAGATLLAMGRPLGLRPIWTLPVPGSFPMSGRLYPPRSGLEAAWTTDQAHTPSPTGAPQQSQGEARKESRLLVAAGSFPPEPRPARLPAFDAVLAGIGAIWAAGTLWLGIRLLVGQRQLARLRCYALPVQDPSLVALCANLAARHQVTPPELLTLPTVGSPFLTGWRQPTILLPTDWRVAFSPLELKAILAHEVAHHARRDCAWSFVAQSLGALLWPQLLLPILWRRAEQAAEEACDREAVRAGSSARSYARCLLTLAQRRTPGLLAQRLGVHVAPFRSALGRRLERILQASPASDTGLPRRFQIATLVFMTATATLLPGAEAARGRTQPARTEGKRVSHTRSTQPLRVVTNREVAKVANRSAAVLQPRQPVSRQVRRQERRGRPVARPLPRNFSQKTIPIPMPLPQAKTAPVGRAAPIRVTGLVVDSATGAPQAEVEITAAPVGERPAAPIARTDTEGWFTLFLPRGRHRVSVVGTSQFGPPENLPRYSTEYATDIDIRSGREQELRFSIDPTHLRWDQPWLFEGSPSFLPTAFITGRVLHSRTGEPLVGVQVMLGRRQPSGSVVVTDAEGRFRFVTVPGWNQVRLQRESVWIELKAGRISMASEAPYREEFQLREGASKELLFRISPEELQPTEKDREQAARLQKQLDESKTWRREAIPAADQPPNMKGSR